MSGNDYMPPPPTPREPSPPRPPPIVVVEKKSGTWWKVLLGIFVGLILLVAGCTALIGTAANEVIEDMEAEDRAVLSGVRVTDCRIDRLLGFGEATVSYTGASRLSGV